MALEPGAKLGPYEIIAAIGAGGMGEVYRARDSRLRRDVAIKVLPAELVNDPERLHSAKPPAPNEAAVRGECVVLVLHAVIAFSEYK